MDEDKKTSRRDFLGAAIKLTAATVAGTALGGVTGVVRNIVGDEPKLDVSSDSLEGLSATQKELAKEILENNDTNVIGTSTATGLVSGLGAGTSLAVMHVLTDDQPEEITPSF
tara:strand:+ start:213 stop:551 length:339 start_codon:yes stop_codon:yes gene_type:complete